MNDEGWPGNDHELSHVDQAIGHLKGAICQGKHWYLALLEAVALWDVTEESHHGRHYVYLIAGEAFDWLVLAERLLQEVDHLVPEDELSDLLFFGKAPVELSGEEFREFIGDTKYKAYLSYFYGVTVEEALLLAMEEKVSKEQHVYALDSNQISELAFAEVYHATRAKLLRRFRQGKGYPQRRSMGLTECKEFTYWLFKYRLKNFDPERVASDTRMGLNELAWQWYLKENEPGSGDSIEA